MWSYVERLLEDARAWCEGKSAWIRLPFLIYFAYVFFNHLANPEYQSIFGGINLGIHELGHFVFRPFGRFLGIAGGTILQLAVPVIVAFVFCRDRNYFGISFCLAWLSTNFFGVSRYCGDAITTALPLVVPGVGFLPEGSEDFHDWHQMLSQMGLLRQCHFFAGIFYLLAILSMIAGLAAMSWILWRMLRSKAPQTFEI